MEFDLRSIPFISKPGIAVYFKDRKLKRRYEPDFVVFKEIVVEIKAQVSLGRADEGQIVNADKCCRRACPANTWDR